MIPITNKKLSLQIPQDNFLPYYCTNYEKKTVCLKNLETCEKPCMNLCQHAFPCPASFLQFKFKSIELIIFLEIYCDTDLPLNKL